MKNSNYRRAIIEGKARDFLLNVAEELKNKGFDDNYFADEAEKNAGNLFDSDLEDVIYEVANTVWSS